MLLPPSKLREIIKQAQFEDELRELESDPVRADEFIEGAEFVLSRNPEYGTKVARDVWFLPMWRQTLGHSVSLFYAYDPDRVFFLSIQRAPDAAEE
jgi:hypothetical protein